MNQYLFSCIKVAGRSASPSTHCELTEVSWLFVTVRGYHFNFLCCFMDNADRLIHLEEAHNDRASSRTIHGMSTCRLNPPRRQNVNAITKSCTMCTEANKNCYTDMDFLYSNVIYKSYIGIHGKNRMRHVGFFMSPKV